MKKINETLYILHKCDFNIQLVWQAIIDHQQKGPLFRQKHFTENLTHYIILESQSFFEEYQKRFTTHAIEKEYSDRVQIVRDICEPIIEQIKKWKGLKNFRNNFIAHPWRDKNKFVVPLNKNYDIPRTWIEFQFLKDLIHYLHEIIKSEFDIELNEALFYSENMKEEVTPKFSQTSDITNEVKDLMLLVDKKMHFHKKDYSITFFYYK